MLTNTWSKLFWSLLYPSNVMCSIHCMMVLVMMFPPNRLYIVKICMCHWCVSIKGNTLRFDVNFLEPYSIHIGLPPDYNNNGYDGWNICYGWIDHLHYWYTKSRLYQMSQMEYWNFEFRSWIYIKNWSLWCTICHILVWFHLSHFWW